MSKERVVIKDIMNTTSVTRLRGILQSRYGKGLELSFINDTSSSETPEGSFSVRNGTLVIPISYEGKFLALAKVPKVSELTDSSSEAIAAIVKLILEPALYKWFLDNTLQNHSEVDSYSNLHVVRENFNLNDTNLSDEGNHNQIQLPPDVVLLTTFNPNNVNKVAMQIHDLWSTRWAMVRWSDIRSQIATVRDIADLGKITILVEDIFNLSDDEKFLLNQWFKMANADSEPSLILGSNKTWSEINEEELLPEPLLRQTGFSQIDVDKLPVDRRLSNEAIQLLLDKSTLLQ